MANPKQLGFLDGNHPTSAHITIRARHELLLLADLIPWPDLMEIAISVRESRIKSHSGPEPHYRELLGAVALMSVRKITFRDAEDLIAHYAPARYLCGLMDSSWQPDHITIFEFTQMLGPEGMNMINRQILLVAQKLDILDSSSLMSDTTAQEAKIPYPNEVGLMSRFTCLVAKNLKKVGGKFLVAKSKVKEIVKKVKGLVRGAHLFAKTREAKQKIGKKIYHTTKELQQILKNCLAQGGEVRSKSAQELKRLSELMDRLLPQILHFLTTGFVAAKKIIHLQAPELYSIVRGKSGKSVEFGLKWGVNRIDGFAMGFLINSGANSSDQKFCLQAIAEHIELFGKAPKIFGFDRGGYSKMNIKRAKKMGVKNVGIAPKGLADWNVTDQMADKIKRERAQVEGIIGTVKSQRYGFNKPDAKSTRAMETYGHRAFLGMNLRKTVRMIMAQELQAT